MPTKPATDEQIMARLKRDNEIYNDGCEQIGARDDWIEKALPSLRGTRDACLRYAWNAVDGEAEEKHRNDAKRLSALIVEGEAILGVPTQAQPEEEGP
ncbi:hypothetical protein LCGC14_2118590 [marine sediment metagenome]|uniref:Uncharacterized protein n=1 Tax=marine sediment metagenome TaxID=412755 RepID=A0A0F9GI16_9ZZZZ